MTRNLNVIWCGKFFRAVSLPISPIDNTYDVVIERAVGDGWERVPGGYNSLSDDYAFTNAREAAQRRERDNTG